MLVGRDDQLETFDVLLERLRRGHTEQSMLITGLGGVGKTVLLTTFEDRARALGWTTVEAEITRTLSSARGSRSSYDARWSRSPRGLPGRTG